MRLTHHRCSAPLASLTFMLEAKRKKYFIILSAVFAAIIWQQGIQPTVNNTRGDFANYFTAASLVCERKPLARAYQDFTWFQMQMDRHGIVHQVGGFIPHPPSTALVLLPLTKLDPVQAKRVWTIFNVLLIAVIVWALSRLTGLDWPSAAFIFLSSGMALINNFLFGQQYLLLVATIVLGLLANRAGHQITAGVLLGLMIPIKYVGVLFVIYFAWKRCWRLVFAASGTALAVVLVTVALVGVEPFRVFFTEVLPRHLRGEIQNPYAVQFQSWNSLLRTLFVYDETLNPQPLLHAPLLFVIGKNLIFWSLLTAVILVTKNLKINDPQQRFLFEIGLIPLAFLLLSPGSATYHFLLLAISAVAFVKILLEHGRPRAAIALAVLFLAINLPHYLRLLHFAQGWTIPLAYPRLWLLFSFGLLVVWFFRANLVWASLHRQAFRAALVVIIIVMAATKWGAKPAVANNIDGANWLPIADAEFNRHYGLVLKHLDRGYDEFVFSYCELRNEQYTIHSTDIGRWTPLALQNFYHPDLFEDDRSLLVETVRTGRSEIWLSRTPGEVPAFVVAGEQPSWRTAVQFVFVRSDSLFLGDLFGGAMQLVSLHGANASSLRIFDPKCSPASDRVSYCVERGDSHLRYELRVFEIEGRHDKLVLQSESRFEQPSWSPDGEVLLFAWRKSGNRDIWALRLNDASLTQLTLHPGEDTSPVWERESQRILFLSDRGRGLECSTIFWLEVPEGLKYPRAVSER